jgi:hypothetical protein
MHRKRLTMHLRASRSVCRSPRSREKDRGTVFQVEALAAVGVREEAFHFPGARNQLIDFGYLASRE